VLWAERDVCVCSEIPFKAVAAYKHPIKQKPSVPKKGRRLKRHLFKE
jgi:hypothetical protein